MPGLVVSIGGRLDPSLQKSLATAAKMAQQQAREIEMIRSDAPRQLAAIEKRLASLPANSISRPYLEGLKATLVKTAGAAGGEAGAGFITRFMEKMKGTGGSGMSQLISVFSNTLSSLGAGISPARVFAQQAPNFAQAFTLMSKNAFAAIMGFLFNPFTWAITGLVAAAAGGAYLIYRHFHNLALGLGNVANKFGLAKVTTEGLNKAMKAGEDATRGYKTWLDKIGKSTETLGDITERLLKKMREQARMERELAQARGASPRTLTGMEISELQLEIAALEQARQKQRALNEENLKAANQASDRLSARANSNDLANLDNASRARDDAAKVLDMVRAKSDLAQMAELRRQLQQDPNATTTRLVPAGMVAGVTTYQQVTESVAETLRKLEGKIINVDKGTLKFHGTLADADREFRAAVALEKQFQDKQADLNRALKEKQDLVEQGKTVDKSLTDQISQLQTELGLKQKYGPQLDMYRNGGGGGNGFVTDRERIGLGASSSINVSILDMSRKQLVVQRELLKSHELLRREIYNAGGF